jgi:hypothetical protein
MAYAHSTALSGIAFLGTESFFPATSMRQITVLIISHLFPTRPPAAVVILERYFQQDNSQEDGSATCYVS